MFPNHPRYGVCPLLLEKYLWSSTIMLEITVQITNILRFLNPTNPKSFMLCTARSLGEIVHTITYSILSTYISNPTNVLRKSI